MKSNEPTMKASKGTGQRSAAHPPAGRVGAPPRRFTRISPTTNTQILKDTDPPPLPPRPPSTISGTKQLKGICRPRRRRCPAHGSLVNYVRQNGNPMGKIVATVDNHFGVVLT